MKRLALAVLMFLLAAQVYADTKVRNVAIFLYDGAEVLDWTGPAEVIQAAGSFGGHGDPAFKLFTVAVSKTPITTQRVIKVTPDYSIADAPKIDVLIIPGGNTGPTQANAEVMDWLRKTITDSEITLTVCTGAFPVAKLGFLDGMEITTWYGAIDGLQTAAPKTQVKRGRRFVDNGKFITTAGVSAGIDGTLHLVGRLLGRRVADQTAQYMEYRWSPESYLAGNYPLLNPSTDERGRQLQMAEMYRDEKNWPAAAEVYGKLLGSDPADQTTWFQYARALHFDGKYDEALRGYSHVTSAPNITATALYNTACIYAVQKKNDQATAYLTKAVEAGFPYRDLLLSDPDLEGVREQAKLIAAKMK